MTLECWGGVFFLFLYCWFGLLFWVSFQILTKIVALVKLFKPHGLTQKIYNKLANGDPCVLPTSRGGA